MKKLLLINPYNPQTDHIQPPLGLGYLAAAARKNGIAVSLYDANRFKTDSSKLIKLIKKEKPDFVGFQFYTMNFDHVKRGLETVKKTNENIITIVGGPHPSALPKETLADLGKNLDFAFCGEAEIGLPQLLKTIEEEENQFSDIPGLIYRKEEETIINEPYFSKDIDEFDPPAWDLLKPNVYPEAQHGAFFENFPIAPIITTRGCPFNCTFCAGKLNTGSVLRKRSVTKVIEEIKYLHTVHHIKEFHIVDDNFTLDRDFAKKILAEIIKLDLKISFAVPNGIRLDTLDKEIIVLMKNAGFYLISVGIESGSDRVLKLMGKHLSVKQIKEKISLIKSAGLDAAGFFILGYPGETEKEIKKTINFSLNLGLLRANYFLFLPLPGTIIFQQLQKGGGIGEIEYNKLSFTAPVFTDNLSKKRLKTLQRQAFLRFYFLRPKILIKNLLKIKKPAQVKFLLRRAFHWLF